MTSQAALHPTSCLPRGSLWRRWDPHVHFPGTLFEDGYGTTSIDDALEALASRAPLIEVVGVTDYFVTASYRAVAAAWAAGAGQAITYLFPNVELRLDVPTAKAGSAVNVHLLTAPEQVDELDRFLGSLQFSWGGQKFRADPSGLMALGRAFTGNRLLEDHSAIREGAGQFKVSFEDLRDNYLGNSWARHHCLVALAGGSGDGSSGVRTSDGAFTARRQSIEGLAHIIFSANPKQRDFWLGRGPESLADLRWCKTLPPWQ